LKCLSVSTKLHGATSQKTCIFILISMKTWNFTFFLLVVCLNIQVYWLVPRICWHFCNFLIIYWLLLYDT
jgi:hypothetical protein